MVHDALESTLRAASDDNMPPALFHQLRDAVLGQYHDMFRLDFGPDPPLDVPPVQIVFKEDAVWSRPKPRALDPQRQAFLREQFDLLESCGMVQRVDSLIGGSPVHVVRKAGVSSDAPLSAQFRLTLDARACNANIIPQVHVLPDAESYPSKLSGARFFAKLDLIHAFWQAPLHPDAWRYLGIVLPWALYVSTRLPQGIVDGSGAFQSVLLRILGPLADEACCVHRQFR